MINNTKITINIKPFNDQLDYIIPKYSTSGSVGADLYAITKEPIILKPMSRVLISTNLIIELPLGIEAQIRPRSGMAINHGISVINSPGTIDSDYRGEIKIILINLGEHNFTINHGDKIAQMVISPVIIADFQITQSHLEETQRGHNGFGSTGSK